MLTAPSRSERFLFVAANLFLTLVVALIIAGVGYFIYLTTTHSFGFAFDYTWNSLSLMLTTVFADPAPVKPC